MIKSLRYDRDRVAEARDLRRRWYNGEKVERSPYVYYVPSEGCKAGFLGNTKYDYADMCADADKAIEGQLMALQHQFDGCIDCDFLPTFQLYYMGEATLAAMFGAEQLVVKDNPPYTKGRVMNTIYDLVSLPKKPDIEGSEWGMKLKEHMLRMADATNGEIPMMAVDYQSPYGTATKLIKNEELMLAMYDEPEMVHEFFNIVTNGIIELIETIIGWVGKDLFCVNNTNPIAGDCGIGIWDDYISVLTPELHTEFCAPYNNRLFEKFGKGHLHTCGPYFPRYIDACLACRPASMDCSIMRGMGKTREDMLEFRRITREHGIKVTAAIDASDGSIFDNTFVAPDRALYKEFMHGGYLMSVTWPKEDAPAFKKLVLDLSGELRAEGKPF